MKYSVWNNDTRSYDYYEAPGAPGIHAGAPPRVRGSALGATPDQAAWPLPGGAQKVGNGAMPQGRIASLGGDSPGDWPRLLIGIGIAGIIYRAWSRQ